MCIARHINEICNLGQRTMNRHPVTKFVTYRLPNGQCRRVSVAMYKRLLASSKGGQVAQARGPANRFMSETGRKAARRLWDRVYRVNKRVGIRLGRTKIYRPQVNRSVLRALYSERPACGIWY